MIIKSSVLRMNSNRDNSPVSLLSARSLHSNYHNNTSSPIDQASNVTQTIFDQADKLRLLLPKTQLALATPVMALSNPDSDQKDKQSMAGINLQNFEEKLNSGSKHGSRKHEADY